MGLDIKKTLSLVVLIFFLPSPLLSGEGHKHRHIPFGSIENYIRVMEDPGRAEWQKPDRVVDVLSIKPGYRIADIGAGSGYFTRRFARVVGQDGVVYAVDIEKGMIEFIEKTKREENLTNIRTILASPDDPGLEPGAVDMVFICDTYHHIESRIPYMKRLRRVLRDGGRLVIVDFKPEPTPVGPPLRIRISRKKVIDELKKAGYVLEGEFYFLPYQYFLIFVPSR